MTDPVGPTAFHSVAAFQQPAAQTEVMGPPPKRPRGTAPLQLHNTEQENDNQPEARVRANLNAYAQTIFDRIAALPCGIVRVRQWEVTLAGPLLDVVDAARVLHSAVVASEGGESFRTPTGKTPPLEMYAQALSVPTTRNLFCAGTAARHSPTGHPSGCWTARPGSRPPSN